MNEQVSKLLLPFITPAKDRKTSFGKDMERAVILCLAEMERKKGGGLVGGKEGEKLAFIAQVFYPVWLAPWKERSLLFDGMGVAGYTATYSVLPQVQEFIEDVEESGKTCEAYSAFLSDSLNYFKNFASEEEKTVNGVIVNPELIQDFIPYLEEMKRITEELSDRLFLAPALDESTISSTVQDLLKIRKLVEKDIENLQKIMDLLNNTTIKHVKTIQKEIKEVRKRFNRKIADLKPSVMEEIQRIKREYNEKITKCTQEAKPQLRRLHQEHAKLEKTIEARIIKIERCEAEVKSCKLRKDEEGEFRWKKEITRCRKEISEVEKEIKALDEKIEAEEAKKKREIANLRAECDEQVEEANKKLRELEASRDGEISMDQKEIELLEDSTSTIIDQINNLLTLKKKALDELVGLGLPKAQTENALVHIPTYFVCYEKNSEERYQLYSPSFAGSLGILTKFKGVFGVSRVKSLLKPRSKALISFLNQLLDLMTRDPVFKKNLLDAGFEANIFGTTESRLDIEIGLKRLREEEWISQSELESLSSFLQEE
ncbi:MAG: hypothetical protein U9O89_03430 [Thermoproteota archaeon]|nr:hypothetical protein [Thermoproteota archaeon]